MSSRSRWLGVVLASTLFLALGAASSAVYWVSGAREFSYLVRWLLVVAVCFIIAREVRRRFDLPSLTMVLAWYAGFHLGNAIGIAQHFGFEALAASAPSLASLGMLPPEGQPFSLASSAISLGSSLIVLGIVLLGTRAGRSSGAAYRTTA